MTIPTTTDPKDEGNGGSKMTTQQENFLIEMMGLSQRAADLAKFVYDAKVLQAKMEANKFAEAFSNAMFKTQDRFAHLTPEAIAGALATISTLGTLIDGGIGDPGSEAHTSLIKVLP